MGETTPPPFTPGPWPLETVKTSVGVCHKIGAFPTGLAHRPVTYGCVYEDGTARWRDMPQETELLANARLMAAAPDLYAALTACVEHFGDPLKLAHAALRKADGR